jgi:hypothetical protein
MKLDSAAIIRDIDAALTEWRNLRDKARYPDCSDQPHEEQVRVGTLLASAIDRLAPPRSVYHRQASDLVEQSGSGAPHTKVLGLPGILMALRADYEAHRMKSVVELVHADLFGDFLEMASYLLDDNWKDAAAVIAGSALEAHLRKLCDQFSVDTHDAAGKPKKASVMNAELRKANAYEKGDEKSITAWLDVRNHAAHGDYGKYVSGQVALLIAGVRAFIARHPA